MTNSVSLQSDNPFSFQGNLSVASQKAVAMSSQKIANLLSVMNDEDTEEDIGSCLSGATQSAALFGSFKLISDASSANLYRQDGDSWAQGVKNMYEQYGKAVHDYAGYNNNRWNIFENHMRYKSASEAIGDINKDSRKLVGYGAKNRMKRIFGQGEKIDMTNAQKAKDDLKAFQNALKDESLEDFIKTKKGTHIEDDTGILKRISNWIKGKAKRIKPQDVDNVEDMAKNSESITNLITKSSDDIATGTIQAARDTLKGNSFKTYMKSMNGMFSKANVIMSVGGGLLTEWGNISGAFQISTESGLKQLGKSALSVGADFIAYGAGEYIGGAVGAAVGSLLGPLGTAVGSFLGGMLGGCVASWATRTFITEPLLTPEVEISEKQKIYSQSTQIASDQNSINEILAQANQMLEQELETNGQSEKAYQLQAAITAVTNDYNNTFASQSSSTASTNPFAFV